MDRGQNQDETPQEPGGAPARPVAYGCLVISILGAAAAAGVAAIIIGALLVSVAKHKQEAKSPYFHVVELTDDTEDPAVWGRNFPQHYDLYRRTVDMQRTKFGGSEALPRTPTEADPRSVVARSKLEADPRLKTMYAGYAFAADFREARGHAYMLEDQTFTLRQKVKKQPGACLNCHASMVVPYRRAGNGDPEAGFAAICAQPYAAVRNQAKHPIACIDCHDPKTMQLRISRPAFIEGIRNAKAAAGIPNYDVNTMATRQEMRSYVCGQCHVEYYFKGDAKRLTFPWHNGFKVESIIAYYDREQFSDWKHKITGAPVLKAQHPEFELWNQGIHARSGVACADCHMPYKRVGAMKISDHHVRSPLLNLNNACQTCHRESEDELKARVEQIQDRTFELRARALDALVDLTNDLKARHDAGAAAVQLTEAYKCQREAQFRIDFIESENSGGFHAPQEAARILAAAIDYCRKGQNALR